MANGGNGKKHVPPQDRSKLSHDPAQIRRRLRRAAGSLDGDLEEYTKATGFKPVEEWDLEELARGKPRNARGDFRGKAPTWIAPAITREAKRRLHDESFGMLAANAGKAVTVIVKLMEDRSLDDNGRPVVDARTKLEAAKFVIEHIIGKPKAVVEIDGSDRVAQFLARALVLDSGEAAHPVIDGHLVANDEEEDDDDEG